MTYAQTHYARLDAARVDHADAELDRELKKLRAHPEVQRAGAFDEAGVLRAAQELGLSDLADLPNAWRHWHEETFSPDAIRNAIGQPWALRRSETGSSFTETLDDDPDIAAVEAYAREMNRRSEQYKLGASRTEGRTWEDVEHEAAQSVRANRAEATEPQDDSEATGAAPSWEDVEANVETLLAAERSAAEATE